jgi:hypothetical protein
MKPASQVELLADILRQITHEYAQENLRPLFDNVLQHAPSLLDIIRRSHDYSRRYLR